MLFVTTDGYEIHSLGATSDGTKQGPDGRQTECDLESC